MNLKFTVWILLFWFTFSRVTISYGQVKSFDQLEQEIYRLNNELKYNESQSLLFPILQSERFSADEKYQAALLLSYTYKRVFDYQSTLKFLGIARTFAGLSSKKAQYLNMILAEEAFVYFDKHDYRASDSLMSLLQKANFNHVSLENKSKLIMQQGYVLFLDGQYQRAEDKYNRAIGMMHTSAPCHLPMIYVKKMQLYNVMNRLDLLDEALRKSALYADSCHIIKYHLYAYEELKKIYTDRNDLPKIAQTQKKLDSLNTIYAREEYIASLHNQQEKILSYEKEQKIKNEQVSKRYMAVVLAGLFVVFLALLLGLLIYRRQQRRKDIEFNRMKLELETYLAQRKKAMPEKATLDVDYAPELSERQREVLVLMATGASNKVIADRLFISENTVKYHIKNIYQLLEIEDRKKFLASLQK